MTKANLVNKTRILLATLAVMVVYTALDFAERTDYHPSTGCVTITGNDAQFLCGEEK